MKMTVREPLVLYTRTACHLCELAAEMLNRAGVEWWAVDIDGDTALTDEYGLHVPVVHNTASGKKLFFPFGDEQLLQFIRSNPLGPEHIP